MKFRKQKQARPGVCRSLAGYVMCVVVLACACEDYGFRLSANGMQCAKGQFSAPPVIRTLNYPTDPTWAPAGVALNRDGTLALMTSTNSPRVSLIQPLSDTQRSVASPFPGMADGTFLRAQFREPLGIAFAPAPPSQHTVVRNVALVADRANHAIRSIELNYELVTTVAGRGNCGFMDGPGSVAAFCSPFDVSISPDSNTAFVADAGNHRVRRIDMKTRSVTTLAGTGQLGSNDGQGRSARFNYPQSVVITPDGKKLLVSDTRNNIIRNINLATLEVSTLAGMSDRGGGGYLDGQGTHARFRSPYGLAVLPQHLQNGRVLWSGFVLVADQGNHAIRRIELSSGKVTTFAGSRAGYTRDSSYLDAIGSQGHRDGDKSSASQFSNPKGLAVSSGGWVLVADSSNHVLRLLGSGACTDCPGDTYLSMLSESKCVRCDGEERDDDEVGDAVGAQCSLDRNPAPCLMCWFPPILPTIAFIFWCAFLVCWCKARRRRQRSESSAPGGLEMRALAEEGRASEMPAREMPRREQALHDFAAAAALAADAGRQAAAAAGVAAKDAAAVAVSTAVRGLDAVVREFEDRSENVNKDNGVTGADRRPWDRGLTEDAAYAAGESRKVAAAAGVAAKDAATVAASKAVRGLDALIREFEDKDRWVIGAAANAAEASRQAAAAAGVAAMDAAKQAASTAAGRLLREDEVRAPAATSAPASVSSHARAATGSQAIPALGMRQEHVGKEQPGPGPCDQWGEWQESAADGAGSCADRGLGAFKGVGQDGEAGASTSVAARRADAGGQGASASGEPCCMDADVESRGALREEVRRTGDSASGEMGGAGSRDACMRAAEDEAGAQRVMQAPQVESDAALARRVAEQERERAELLRLRKCEIEKADAVYARSLAWQEERGSAQGGVGDRAAAGEGAREESSIHAPAPLAAAAGHVGCAGPVEQLGDEEAQCHVEPRVLTAACAGSGTAEQGVGAKVGGAGGAGASDAAAAEAAVEAIRTAAEEAILAVKSLAAGAAGGARGGRRASVAESNSCARATAAESNAAHECIVCLENPSTMALLPCGHRCACEGCALGLKTCPLCRADVVQAVRIYV